MAFAVVVGAHFLPYQWLHKTKLYGVLAIVVSAGAYAVAVIFGEAALHYTGFYVGACLLVASVFALMHARRFLHSLQSAVA